MLIEVKVKVARIIDGRTRKRTETYVTDQIVFANAEYQVLNRLSEEQNAGLVDGFEIQSLKISSIKEICTQWLEDYTLSGYPAFLATLKDIYLGDDHEEKPMKYRVLLWAENHSQALHRVQELARQGYDMQIEGIKQVDYDYLTETPEVTNSEEEENDGNS